MKSNSGFLQFINNCMVLGDQNLDAWEKWKGKFIESLDGHDPDLFWYLSAGTDFFPLRHFHHDANTSFHADAFFYSDQEPLGMNIISQINAGRFNGSERWKSQNLDLDNAFMVSHPDISKPIAFFLFQDKHDAKQKLRPLFFLHSTNFAALTSFVYQNFTFKYLSTVADGCRALDPEDRSLCPLSLYGFYSKVMDGYWLSDHLPETVQSVFRKKEAIKGWGRYNLEEKTWIYKVNC